MVHIGVVGKSGGAGGVVESPLRRKPGILRKAPHRNETFGIVKIIRPEIHIAFQFPQVGQDAGKPPLVVAERGPGVVILRHAAQ